MAKKAMVLSKKGLSSLREITQDAVSAADPILCLENTAFAVSALENLRTAVRSRA